MRLAHGDECDGSGVTARTRGGSSNAIVHTDKIFLQKVFHGWLFCILRHTLLDRVRAVESNRVDAV
jgi:hypothetical protein